MISADISNLETEVEVKLSTMMMSFSLFLPLRTNISWLFIAHYFLHTSLHGMFFLFLFFNTQECPMCGFNVQHMEW